LGPLVTEFVCNFGRENARPIQHAHRQSAPYLTWGRGDWFRVRNVTQIEFQKSRRCAKSGCPLPSESSRVTPRDTTKPSLAPASLSGLLSCCPSWKFRRSSAAVATSRADRRLPRSGWGDRHRRWGRGRPKADQRVGPRLAETGWGQIHDRQLSIPCLGKRSSREERDRNPKPAAEPASQPMNTEKTNGESTPPAITSFSPARSAASSPRK